MVSIQARNNKRTLFVSEFTFESTVTISLIEAEQSELNLTDT